MTAGGQTYKVVLPCQDAAAEWVRIIQNAISNIPNTWDAKTVPKKLANAAKSKKQQQARASQPKAPRAPAPLPKKAPQQNQQRDGEIDSSQTTTTTTTTTSARDSSQTMPSHSVGHTDERLSDDFNEPARDETQYVQHKSAPSLPPKPRLASVNIYSSDAPSVDERDSIRQNSPQIVPENTETVQSQPPVRRPPPSVESVNSFNEIASPYSSDEIGDKVDEEPGTRTSTATADDSLFDQLLAEEADSDAEAQRPSSSRHSRDLDDDDVPAATDVDYDADSDQLLFEQMLAEEAETTVNEPENEDLHSRNPPLSKESQRPQTQFNTTPSTTTQTSHETVAAPIDTTSQHVVAPDISKVDHSNRVQRPVVPPKYKPTPRKSRSKSILIRRGGPPVNSSTPPTKEVKEPAPEPEFPSRDRRVMSVAIRESPINQASRTSQ